MSSNIHLLTSSDLQEAIIREPLTVTPETTVREAIIKMGESHARCNTSQQQNDFLVNARSSCVLVVEAEQVIGILTERDVVRLTVQESSLEELIIKEVMGNSVITLRESQFNNIFSAINLLQQQKIRHLPLTDEQNHLVGLVTHATLQHITRPVDLLRLRLVREVMVRDVICAEPTASMLEIAQQMSSNRVSCIIIAENQTLPVGIVTERDLVQFKALDLNPEQHRVEFLMSTPVFTIRPNESLWTLQRMMQQHFIHRVVVTNKQGKLLGIVTQSSILQALNPLELYKLAEVLEVKVEKLEAEKIVLLQSRTKELEKQVKARTHALNRKVEKETLLAELGAKMLASLEISTLLETTVQQLREFLGCDRINIWQFNKEWISIVVAESTESPLSLVGRQINDTCFGQDMAEIYRQGRVRVVDDIYTTEMSDCHREMLISLQTRAKVIVPLLCGQQLWGLLNVTESQFPRNWRTEEIELVKAVSVQLSIALKQVTIHQQLEEELKQRQQTEVKLRESQKRYISLTNAAPVGIFRTDAEGNCLYVSDRWCEIAGMIGMETMGEGWLQAIHPDDRDLVSVKWCQAIEQDLCFQLEYRFQRCSDGKVTWVYGQAVTEKNDEGEVIGYVGTVTDITPHKEAEAERLRLEQLSQTDGLTHIANRRYFDQVLGQEWQRSQREQCPLSLIIFDVDYFKGYNDCYGHPMGDECLIKLAQTTQQMVNRSTDLVARYGGEEFVILLPNTDEIGAVTIAKKLQQEIKALAIPHEGSEISQLVTVSIGISTMIPVRYSQSQQDILSPDILTAQADQSLYRAKHQGRNCYVIYSASFID